MTVHFRVELQAKTSGLREVSSPVANLVEAINNGRRLQSLFDTGGGTWGTTVAYETGNIITIAMCQNAIRVLPLSYTVPTSLIGKWVDVIVTYKLVSATNGRLSLYVNGVETAAQGAANVRWTGTDQVRDCQQFNTPACTLITHACRMP